MSVTVLDNVASGIKATIPTRGKFAVWLAAGSAQLNHDGDNILTLVAGERKAVEVGGEEEIEFEATGAGTTVKISPIHTTNSGWWSGAV